VDSAGNPIVPAHIKPAAAPIPHEQAQVGKFTIITTEMTRGLSGQPTIQDLNFMGCNTGLIAGPNVYVFELKLAGPSVLARSADPDEVFFRYAIFQTDNGPDAAIAALSDGTSFAFPTEWPYYTGSNQWWFKWVGDGSYLNQNQAFKDFWWTPLTSPPIL
jgi:hypothetical protein